VEVKAKEEENSKQKIEINKKNEEIDNQKKEIEELKHKKTLVPQAMKNIKKASDDERDTETPSPENQPAKEGNGQSWGAWAWQNKSKIGGVAWLAYVAANVGLDIAGNSSSAVGNPVNSAENDTLSLNLSSTCPNPTMQRPYELQCKLDENVIKLANAEKCYNDTLSLSSTRPNPIMQRPYNNVEASSPENQPAKKEMVKVGVHGFGKTGLR